MRNQVNSSAYKLLRRAEIRHWNVSEYKLWYLSAAEEDKAIGAIPTKPIESKDLSKICAQHRRYPVLYKVEFQVSKWKIHANQTTGGRLWEIILMQKRFSDMWNEHRRPF